MDAVVDTNVIVSGLIRSQGNSAVIIQMITSGELVPLFDDRILQEYGAVLKREKFGFPLSAVDGFLSAIKTLGRQLLTPHSTIQLPDPKDLCFYECAMMAKTKILITGNKKHFPENLCGDIRVMSPGEFLSEIK